jgi:SAM-dependent methyltransferase
MSESEFDYSIQYSRFHKNSAEYADRLAAELVKELSPSLPEDLHGRVLDVGCGYGFALLALRKLGFECIQGLEISNQQAERARQFGLEVEVVSNTTNWIKSHTGVFSVVILRDVLEHVPVDDQIPLLRAIFHSLVPGGRAIIQVPNANAILAARWRYNDTTHHSSFTEHSLYFVLRNAGFKGIVISNDKGVSRPSLRLWRKNVRANFATSLRRYLVRWWWLQVFKAELPWERLDEISFDLNLKAVAFHRD